MIPIRQIPTNVILLSAVLTLSLFLVSCGGDDGGGTDGGGATDVEVVDFTPNSAFVGDDVQIDGLGFSGSAGDNQIWFNDTEAATDSVSLTEGSDSGTLFTTVPEGATDGPIAVSVDGGDRAESGSDFTVEEPDEQEGGEEFATVYWSGQRSESVASYGVIGRSYTNDQGRKFSEVLYDLISISEDGVYQQAVYGLALDLNNNLMYWADSGLRGADPMILRSSLDGDIASVDTLYTQADGIVEPNFVILDLEASAIYWADFGQGIMRGSLDGSAPAETVYDAGSTGIDGAIGIDMMLDPGSDMFYWSEFNTGEITRAPKDGSGPVEVLFEEGDASPALEDVYDIMVNTEEEYLLVSAEGRILRGSLDGTGSLETIYELPGEANYNTIAYDAQRDFVYWSSEEASNGGVIMRGRPDGSREAEVAYDLREFAADYGSRVSGMAIAPDPGSAKAKGSGQIPPVYLKF